MKKICITGPDDSGKTTLAKAMAHHFKTYYVPDYAGEYLEMIGREPEERDMLNIAKGQLNAEREYTAMAKDLLICDTSVQSKKWKCDFHYGKHDEWFEKKLKSLSYDHFLLLPPPQKGDVDNRSASLTSEKLFEFFKKRLAEENHSFTILSESDYDRRINEAKEIISAL